MTKDAQTADQFLSHFNRPNRDFPSADNWSGIIRYLPTADRHDILQNVSYNPRIWRSTACPAVTNNRIPSNTV